MCNPGSIFSFGAGALEAAGSEFAGEAKAQENEFKSLIYGVNADIAESNVGLLRNEADIAASGTDLAYSKGALEESRIRKTDRDVAAAQRVDFTSRNLDPTVGSPLVLAARSAGQVQADIEIVRATAAMEAADAMTRSAKLRAQAFGQKGQAFAQRTSASMSLLAGQNARIAGHIGAGVALLKGTAAALSSGGGGPNPAMMMGA